MHVEKGSPADALQALAEKGEADLIVLGSTHHAALGSVAPGSVAEHLLHGAKCRLVIAPKGYAEQDHSQDRLRVVAVGYDGMAESQAALDEAATLARKFRASMRVIGVMTPAPPVAAAAAQGSPKAGPDFQTRLHQAVAELEPELRALPVIQKGDPVAGSKCQAMVSRTQASSTSCGASARRAPCDARNPGTSCASCARPALDSDGYMIFVV